ncbi:endosome-associated-trafficking regulator 1 isoform X2 [Aplysia californica]|uniref:Endosome-associated-trafficking regulator 1 n=1 Tax=Aplysia californica TaxID=6500 RepID=A0ABM1W1T8_APLCA|nr:endosome-associated-trafficking regulator 1 isoform X2 [Aplysia californica]
MADMGGDQNNPFSFKNFVSDKDKKTKTTDGFSGDEDDIFGLNQAKPKRNEKAKVDPDGSKGAKKKDKQKENPFSFKKFLSASSNEKPPKGDDRSQTAPPDIASDVPLFVNNHFTEASNNGADALEDDFDFSFESVSRVPPPDPLEVHGGFQSTNHTDALSLSDSSSFNGAGLHSDDISSSSGLQLGLPDFLSDMAALNAGSKSSSSLQKERGRSTDQNEDLLSQIRIMQEENDRLRSELTREKQRCSEKNQKLSQLKIDLERQKKKEAEETAVMERAVQQVEENLVTTTTRAVQAEASAAKLKQEVKSLQNQVQSLTVEVEALKSGDAGLADLRERTKYSAEQLSFAAVTAEKNLKELMSGVEKLKLVSLVLSSLEKVSEVPPEQSREQEGKPS